MIDRCAMRGILLTSLVACAALPAQTVPLATDLPSHPFFIKATWYIGGAGTWDYLTMDSRAGRLYIAHGTAVQVVDITSGTLIGTIDGFYEVRQIVLDDTGQLGYISDGGLGKVTVFDRQTLKKMTEIDTGANPRSMVFDSLTKLLFVVLANPPAEGSGSPESHRHPSAHEGPTPEAPVQSKVTVIDTQTETAIGEIVLPGLLGFAVGDQSEDVFVAVTDRNAVVRFDAEAVATIMRQTSGGGITSGAGGSSPGPAKAAAAWTALDWTGGSHGASAAEGRLSVFSLSPECADPVSLAMDSGHIRLFAACDNRKMVVLNAADGSKVTALPIGPGVGAIGYDPEHGLIFTANGGAEGSMTIIRQDVTDTYAIIQTLPTRQRAAMLAVDPDSGAVYSVTDYLGVSLDRPGGIGTLEQIPVKGSFQVLRVAN